MKKTEINTIELIRELSNAYGAPGFEDEVVAIGRKYGEAFADMEEDSIRNLYLLRKANKGDRTVIMLDGHSDEVGFVVQAIKPNGTMMFLANGGWVDMNAAAQKVKVQNKHGEWISGVVSSKPPHFMSEAEKGKSVSLADMTIDVGASSKKEVEEEFGIEIGSPVVPDVTFEFNEKNQIMLGKAFDNRLGCAAVIKTLEALSSSRLTHDIVGTFSTQEETGLRGAKVAAQTVSPDIAIVFEGTPADDTIKPEYEAQAVLKKGPQLRVLDRSMIVNPRFLKYARSIADEKGIPYQLAVRSGGGTNGGSIHLTDCGIPTIVVGIPVRYIHTPNCYASLEDFNNAVKLAVEIVKSINEEKIESF